MKLTINLTLTVAVINPRLTPLCLPATQPTTTNQVNKSRGDVAYNVIDVELKGDANWSNVQKELTMIPEVRSSRFIFGNSPLGGYGYAKNIPNKGYVV